MGAVVLDHVERHPLIIWGDSCCDQILGNDLNQLPSVHTVSETVVSCEPFVECSGFGPLVALPCAEGRATDEAAEGPGATRATDGQQKITENNEKQQKTAKKWLGRGQIDR